MAPARGTIPGRFSFDSSPARVRGDRAMTERACNTNNAWGFGGSYGTEYVFPNGWVLRKGTACYRHLPTRRIIYAIAPDSTRYLDLHECRKLSDFPGALPVDLVTHILENKR